MQKAFCSYEYMCGSVNLKDEFPSKEMFHISLADKKITYKVYKLVYMVRDTFEIKEMKYCPELLLKCHVLLLANVFENF